MASGILTLAEGSVAFQREVGDKNRPGILFFGGYASDMQGTKAGYLAEKCVREGIGFVRFDYRGCGESPGKFTDQTIGNWYTDAKEVFDRLTDGPQILIGSSMGGWIGMLLADARKDRTKALIGIAAAPDFTEELVWKHLTEVQKSILLRDGEIYDDNAPADHRIPMTLKLIEEARQHLIFRKSFSLPCPVRLLQGRKDLDVPYHYAQRIADHIGGNTRVELIENGDHRLSTPENLGMLWQTVAEFL